MEITATRVGVAGAHGPLLAPTSLRLRPGHPLLATGDPTEASTALALVLAGRLRPAHGTVTPDPATLRRTVAVVDAPGVTEPDGALAVRTVVAEGLCMAGRPSNRRAVRNWLADRDLPGDQRFEQLGTARRSTLLIDLACERRTVQAMVLDRPDRHGGSPADWYLPAARQAGRGLAVLILCAPHSAEQLGAAAVRIGSDNTEPLVHEGLS